MSNSAGSHKDRGGIGAEALSTSLGVPVLAHALPKPACGPEIVDYFTGRLGAPTTKRAAVQSRLDRAERQEDEAESDLLSKWEKDVEGPLCGPLIRGARGDLEQRMAAANKGGPAATTSPIPPPESKDTAEARADASLAAGAAPDAPSTPPPAAPASPLRILVVGDRLFTDVLLARRLDTLLPPTAAPLPPALSVVTTALPQPRDLRLVRRIESWLSGYQLADPANPWAAYVRVDPPPPPSLTLRQRISRNLHARWDRIATALNPVTYLHEDGPPLTWHPRTWRWRPILAATLTAAGRGIAAVSRALLILSARAGRVLAAASASAGRASWVHIKAFAATQRVHLKAFVARQKAAFKERRRAAAEKSEVMQDKAKESMVRQGA